MRRKRKFKLPADICQMLISFLGLAEIMAVACIGHLIKWQIALIIVIAIPCLIILCVLVGILVIYIREIPDVIRTWQFNRRFDWILKHKDNLPMTEEERNFFIERNRNFIGIDVDDYNEMKRYYKKSKRKKKPNKQT